MEPRRPRMEPTTPKGLSDRARGSQAGPWGNHNRRGLECLERSWRYRRCNLDVLNTPSLARREGGVSRCLLAMPPSCPALGFPAPKITQKTNNELSSKIRKLVENRSLGLSLGASGALLVPRTSKTYASRAFGRHFGINLGPSWRNLGLSWAKLGPG